MNIVSISDLHLGSGRSMCRQFLAFMRALPPDTMLLLNGDIIDAERRNLTAEHLETVGAICAESFRRRIVWTGGNHDRSYVPVEPNRIEFVPEWTTGQTCFVHGDRFMPAHGLYVMFGQLMRIYRACKVPDSLVTLRFAHRIPLLFRLLRSRSIAKAVRFAERNGYQTMVCGHLHMVIDTTVRGVRYINTGSWTESPLFYLSYRDGEVRLRTVEC